MTIVKCSSVRVTLPLKHFQSSVKLHVHVRYYSFATVAYHMILDVQAKHTCCKKPQYNNNNYKVKIIIRTVHPVGLCGQV